MSHRGAALAELPQFDQLPTDFDVPLQANGEPYPTLQLIAGTEFDQAQDQLPTLIDADSIPELHSTRAKATLEARNIMARNRQRLMEDVEGVALPVDALGTARHVVAIKKQFGEDSPQYKEAYEGLVLDNERLIGEVYRKNTWEYFAPSAQVRDAETDKYVSHGIPVLDITERGLSPIAEPEELERRINDHVIEVANHAMPRVHALGSIGLMETVRSRTISECTYFAIEGYKKDTKASHGGYVPAIEKLMVGDMVFDQSSKRLQEQVGLSGLYITHDVVKSVLARKGAIKAGQNIDKTELHSKQFIDQGGGDLIDFVADLDAEASRVSGKTIFMGEVVDEDHPRDYSTIEDEAEQRRQKLAPKPEELSQFLIMLEEKGTDKWAAEGLVHHYLEEMLHEVVSADPKMAEVIFDKATAEGYAKAAELEADGRVLEANMLREAVKEAAPDASYCGAGSCGLEGVDDSSADAAQARGLGLRGRGFLKDKERACPSCKEKKIMYDSSGNKACTGCKLTQIGGKIAGGKNVVSLDAKRKEKQSQQPKAESKGTSKQPRKSQPKDL